jgi:carboxymethylenebutenolidase
MTKILTLAFLLFFAGAQAQQSCCSSATTEFADLGKDSRFMMEHQLPKASLAIEKAGEMIDFQAGSKAGNAYLANSPYPGNIYLFVFHEWWGLNDHIKAEADKWAESLPGVQVMAIDLYDGKSATTREGASELMQGADEKRIREIINGAIAYAGSDAEFATIGWCFGGGWSMQAAIMMGDRATSCVVYYGMPEKSVDKLKDLNAPVLGIFAEKDQWINRAAIAEYEKSMTAAGKKFESVWFDADHAFANPSNAIFDEKAAGEANKKAISFLYGSLIR